MLNCRQVTRLVSQSMDARLPWHQRLAVRLHLLYCVWCRRYTAQIRFLRQAARTLADDENGVPTRKLSEQARQQIQARLQAELKAPSPPPPPQ